MTQPGTDSPPGRLRRPIPFWRDVRVLGVLGQIGFVIFAILAARTLGANFASNVGRLGEAQFICRDGSHNIRCAYDFMSTEAAFDISETVLNYELTDSYWYAIYIGLLNTIKVAVLGIIFATILGTLAGIARLSENWLIRNIVQWYIEIIRNTPLLIQLVFLYFSVLLALPQVAQAIQPLGLPIYLTQRGLNIPAPEFTPSFPIWFAFLVLGVIQFQVLWVLLSRREEHTGRPANRLGWGLAGFAIVLVLGWVVSVAVSDNQALLTGRATRIREVADIEKFVFTRARVDHIDQLQALPQEQQAAAALKVCVVRDSTSEPNLISQVRKMGLPYTVSRATRPDQATAKFTAGECDVFAAPRPVLAAELATVADPENYLVVPVTERPVVWSIPAREGLNIAGGAKLSPEFTALLVGLIIYTAAFIAEIVRAGIQSVSKGQSEAARALGLTEGQRLQLVVLPQALRVIIPPLTSQYLNLTKNSSLAIAIGFPDLYGVAFTTINQSGRAVQVILIVMVTYLATSLATSALLNWYNERVKLVER
ncbi:MAG: ABC transporter permease subunit [Chloroflexi bacterium]|nr:ABC transporter permease subunit [Chloroflexota bacterium]